jgi:hypothetical protein
LQGKERGLKKSWIKFWKERNSGYLCGPKGNKKEDRIEGSWVALRVDVNRYKKRKEEKGVL